MANTGPGWRIDDSTGVRVIRCAALERFPTVRHAFSTRQGSGDLGAHDSTGAELVEKLLEGFLYQNFLFRHMYTLYVLSVAPVLIFGFNFF